MAAVVVTDALSFLQPWLWAMTYPPPNKRKDVENRSRPPPVRIIGTRIALHASKGIDEDAYLTIASLTGGLSDPTAIHPPEPDNPNLGRGHLVSTAVVAGFMDKDRPSLIAMNERYLRSSPWFFGPYGWILDDIRPLPQFIPMKGALGVWKLPSPVTVEVT